MYLTPDAHEQAVRDRQQRFHAEAAASRLVQAEPARRRFAGFLRRSADRLDAATSPCAHVRSALPQRG